MVTPFEFNSNSPNQLLVNPKATKQEKNDLIFLQFEFEKIYGKTGYFLVPSSGSSKSAADSVKLIALTVDAVLNSAKRVNQFFNLKSDLKWGLVLPFFHVAGLGVYARAHCSKAQVFAADWNANNFLPWIEENEIGVISLVPTQIFDIVQKDLVCPDSVKTVFVGGAGLSAELKLKALDLKWPVVETYGMTETCSMIAAKLIDQFQTLPDVDVAVTNEKLKIKCDSLMTCSVQKINNKIEFKKLDSGWLQTEDRAEIKIQKGIQYIQLLGRDSEFIKINGEGVSLNQLRQTLGSNHHATLIALPNQRTGFEIVFVHESSLKREDVRQLAQDYNQKVRPFETVKKIFTVDLFPISELGKIKFKNLEEAIKGNPYEKL